MRERKTRVQRADAKVQLWSECWRRHLANAACGHCEMRRGEDGSRIFCDIGLTTYLKYYQAVGAWNEARLAVREEQGR